MLWHNAVMTTHLVALDEGWALWYAIPNGEHSGGEQHDGLLSKPRTDETKGDSDPMWWDEATQDMWS